MQYKQSEFKALTTHADMSVPTSVTVRYSKIWKLYDSFSLGHKIHCDCVGFVTENDLITQCHCFSFSDHEKVAGLFARKMFAVVSSFKLKGLSCLPVKYAQPIFE